MQTKVSHHSYQENLNLCPRAVYITQVGPGNNPTPGVTYTYPGPTWTQAVTIALDDPMTVNYP